MQESSRGADHGSDLRLHMSLYAGNCSEHVCTLLIGYRSGGTPGFHTSFGRVTAIAGRRRGRSASSALATSRLFVLPVVARRGVSVDNTISTSAGNYLYAGEIRVKTHFMNRKTHSTDQAKMCNQSENTSQAQLD